MTFQSALLDHPILCEQRPCGHPPKKVCGWLPDFASRRLRRDRRSTQDPCLAPPTTCRPTVPRNPATFASGLKRPWSLQGIYLRGLRLGSEGAAILGRGNRFAFCRGRDNGRANPIRCQANKRAQKGGIFPIPKGLCRGSKPARSTAGNFAQSSAPNRGAHRRFTFFGCDGCSHPATVSFSPDERWWGLDARNVCTRPGCGAGGTFAPRRDLAA